MPIKNVSQFGQDYTECVCGNEIIRRRYYIQLEPAMRSNGFAHRRIVPELYEGEEVIYMLGDLRPHIIQARLEAPKQPDYDEFMLNIDGRSRL